MMPNTRALTMPAVTSVASITCIVLVKRSGGAGSPQPVATVNSVPMRSLEFMPAACSQRPHQHGDAKLHMVGYRGHQKTVGGEIASADCRAVPASADSGNSRFPRV